MVICLASKREVGIESIESIESAVATVVTAINLFYAICECTIEILHSSVFYNIRHETTRVV